MLIKKPSDLRWSDVTPRQQYLQRREFLRVASAAAVGAVGTLACGVGESSAQTGVKLPNVAKNSPLSTTGEKLNSFKDITTYNNFYEFGTEKEEPSRNAKDFKTNPWTLTIDGEVAKKKVLGYDDLFKVAPLEERVYRMRCVEAWSVVVPWVGFPLAALLKLVEPTAKAKYVSFESVYDGRRMLSSREAGIEFPYIEGLRLDEAMHPLTILATGLYEEKLPNQNGAPIRLIVPWKYGFKGIKSITRIRLVEKEPMTTWNLSGPREYGFYSNVNPQVDHPRWTQATERRLGEFLRRKTLMFNGYADQVASMYSGMDLRKFYSTIAVLKTLVFIAALVPLGRLIFAALTGGDLTPNPIEYITRQTGWFALMFLASSLAVTPIRRLTKWHPIIRFRRMLGLFAFFYGSTHLLTWIVLDKFFDYREMIADVVKRPFITIGMATYLLLLPLAVTSTAGWIRRLGGKRWQRLHTLAYVAGVTAVVHFWWLVKSDVREPQRWALLVTVLLGLRAWWTYQARPQLRS